MRMREREREGEREREIGHNRIKRNEGEMRGEKKKRHANRMIPLVLVIGLFTGGSPARHLCVIAQVAGEHPRRRGRR